MRRIGYGQPCPSVSLRPQTRNPRRSYTPRACGFFSFTSTSRPPRASTARPFPDVQQPAEPGSVPIFYFDDSHDGRLSCRGGEDTLRRAGLQPEFREFPRRNRSFALPALTSELSISYGGFQMRVRPISLAEPDSWTICAGRASSFPAERHRFFLCRGAGRTARHRRSFSPVAGTGPSEGGT